MKELVIIGAGGFGGEVKEIIDRMNEKEPQYEVLGYVDDDPELLGVDFCGVKVLGGKDWLLDYAKDHEVYALIAIASFRAKRKLDAIFDGKVKWASAIDPSATVSKYAEIGPGAMIQENVYIGPYSKLGRHVAINTKSSCGHHAVYGDYVSVMSYSDVTGHVVLEDDVYIGSSVCIIPGITVGRQAVLGAGAVVLKDVPPGATVVWNPGKVIKQVPVEE